MNAPTVAHSGPDAATVREDRDSAMRQEGARPAGNKAGIALGAAALILAGVMVTELAINHGTQARIADNGKLMGKNEELAKVDRTLVQLLAKSAFENHDADITALLARNGVTFKEKAAAAPSAAASSASGAQ